MTDAEASEIHETNIVPERPRGYNLHKQYQTLAKKYMPLLGQLEDVHHYRQCKSDILSSAQILVLKYALSPAKLEKATFLQLCTGFEILNKAERLDNNQSTDNIAHQHLGSINLQLPTE